MQHPACARTVLLFGALALAAAAQNTTPPQDQPAQAQTQPQAQTPAQGQAQTPPQSQPDAQALAPAQPPAPSPNPDWMLGPVDVAGFMDGYYSLNFNHPATQTNNFRNFDVRADSLNLNMAKLSLLHDPDPIGVRVDFGAGRTYRIINSLDTGPRALRLVEQAYVDFKPKNAKGLELDFGKFVTSAGAEVIETYSNWNYSRSLLFAYAIPYYHFGLRTSMPVTKSFSAGLQLVSGWNTMTNVDMFKTVGLTGTWTVGKFSWSNNYYVGPDNTSTTKGPRHLYDTTLLVSPNANTSFYINYDYGMDRDITRARQHWMGIAGAARFQVSRRFALAPRLEWFNDVNGFTTGTAQRLKEATMTGEFQFFDGLLTRLEYRRDWSDNPVFDRGALPGSFGNQNTIALGFVAFFGPRR